MTSSNILSGGNWFYIIKYSQLRGNWFDIIEYAQPRGNWFDIIEYSQPSETWFDIIKCSQPREHWFDIIEHSQPREIGLISSNILHQLKISRDKAVNICTYIMLRNLSFCC